MSKPIELQRLLNNTPSPAHADARSRLAEFMNVLGPHELRHVQRAVSMILGGEAEGIDPRYAVYPPMLADLLRKIRDKDLSFDASRRAAIAQIEDRNKVFHEQPVEVRRAAVAEGLARLQGAGPDESPEQIRERQAKTAKRLKLHDRLFLGNDTDESRRARLMGTKT